MCPGPEKCEQLGQKDDVVTVDVATAGIDHHYELEALIRDHEGEGSVEQTRSLQALHRAENERTIQSAHSAAASGFTRL